EPLPGLRRHAATVPRAGAPAGDPGRGAARRRGVSRPAVRLLLADEQPLLRTGFRTVLGAEHGLTVVGEAGDGVQAVELTRRLLPDVVVFGPALPPLGGLGLARAGGAARGPGAR